MLGNINFLRQNYPQYSLTTQRTMLDGYDTIVKVTLCHLRSKYIRHITQRRNLVEPGEITNILWQTIFFFHYIIINVRARTPNQLSHFTTKCHVGRIRTNVNAKPID